MTEARDLERFDLEVAWKIGRSLVDECRDKNLPVTISLWLGEQRVFHAVLLGSGADNDSWVERKARTVRRFGCSSLEAHQRIEEGLGSDLFTILGLARGHYALSGGAVPIRVRGAMVGVIAVSGLEASTDHDLAVSALAAACSDQADLGC